MRGLPQALLAAGSRRAPTSIHLLGTDRQGCPFLAWRAPLPAKSGADPLLALRGRELAGKLRMSEKVIAQDYSH
jgi:hypothetical protein